MADAIVSFILEKLSTMAYQELSFFVGVKEDLEKLSRTFKALQAALHDAENRQVKEELVRDWLGNLKDVAYNVDDLLEEWKVSVASNETVRAYSNLRFNGILFRHKMGRRIKAIRERLDDIRNDKDSFCFREDRKEKKAVGFDNMETSSMIDETEIFGRNRDKERIVSWLVSESSRAEELLVISVLGMGGIGKTALTQLVYKDERVENHFEERIWVSLSDDFDVRKICEAIIKHDVGWSWEVLQFEVQERLREKRFLLVLDGIRNVDEANWDRLRLPIKRSKEGSRILITTRSEHITKTLAAAQTHLLEPLFEDDCWLLFCHRAFSRRTDDERTDLEAIGREIVSKCQGVPLAAKTLGSTLRTKREKWEWELVLESETWNSWDAMRDIVPALSLSYYDMPPHLRRCFAYCSVFPKDHLIEKEKLIKLWMAQGFIDPKEKGDLEKVGSLYFDDLMRRSLFQMIETDEFGDAKYCLMHDMIHDLCKFVMSECVILHDQPSNGDLAKARHASFICNEYVKSIPSFVHTASNLRTFLLIGWSKIPKISSHFFNSLRCLRALDLSGTRIKRVSNSLRNLKLLRYLDLSTTGIQELPEFVSSLSLLQTLKLNHCYKLRKLPKRIVKLVELRHLEVEGTPLEYLPEGIGRLTSLRTLTKFIAGDERGSKLSELKCLNLLHGELQITCLNRVTSQDETNEAELEKKQDLQILQLSCVDWFSIVGNAGCVAEQIEGVFQGLKPHTNLRDFIIADYGGCKFPNWMEDCSVYSNLTKVQLSRCQCLQLPALGKLPSLKWLYITEMYGVKQVGREFCGNSHGRLMVGAFPKLEILLFGFLYVWEEWELNVGVGAIPSLFALCIEECHELRALPDLRYLSTLQQLTINNCRLLKNRCEKDVGEDWNKISHIHSITIDWVRIQ